MLSTEISKVSETLLALSNKQTIADLTSNHAPFPKNVYPQLETLVDQLTTLDSLRNSKDVIKLLQSIIDQCVATILVDCWRIQSIKPRLDAMMTMAVPFITTPLMTSMLNIGESMTQSTRTLDRIKKCIVDIFTFFINSELSLLKHGEDSGNEIDRVELCIALLGSKCSKYSPLAFTLREYAFPLLRGLSLHALGVTALSEDITEAISVLGHHLGCIVLGDAKVEVQTSSSPSSSLSKHVFSTDVIGIQRSVLQSLSPYITDYFVWLLNHKRPFVKICRALEVVEYIHPALRKSLQNEEFSSPTDIINKYEGKYKRHLTLMPLPIQLFQREDILQATKDINREKFNLNSSHCHGSALIPELLDCLEAAFVQFKSRDKCHQLLGGSSGRLKKAKLLDARTRDCDISDATPKSSSKSGKSGHPFAEFIELLSRFLLIASSRTLSSGDAFFVLNDLFGGEGLTLSPKTMLDNKEKDEIKIDISPLHISVECNQFYDLFSTAQITQCKDRNHLAPIISFEIKVFTSFKYGKPVRDFLNLSPSKRDSTENEINFQTSLFSFLFILLSSDPEKICRRSLTIIPLASK